MAILDTTATV